MYDLPVLGRHQGLCADIGQHAGGWEVGDFKERGVKFLTSPVKQDINMLGALLVQGVDGQGDCTLIVDQKLWFRDGDGEGGK